MAVVRLIHGNHDRILNGHPWIFKNEVDKIEGDFNPGDIVEVTNSKGKYIGDGYINPKSQILVRLLTRKHEEINKQFFYNKISDAWEYRKKIMDTNSCRVVFAEADFLPALVVDKFGDYLVIQTLSLGMEKYKDWIVDILDEIIKPKGIYERNDVPVREKEGLKQQKGFLKGDFDTTVVMQENGLKFYVDIENGQKTGYFLDQKENRAALKPFMKNAEVLDCFCHTGSFAVHAAYYGAKSVTGVDISDEAIDFAKRNAELNGLSEVCNFITENSFDLLRRYYDEHKQFDVVILDPPAFTKTRSALQGAIRGYKEINYRTMRILKPGGILVTCSCSQHVYTDQFINIIQDAAHDAKRILRQIEFRTQAKDHPELMAARETKYLKCLFVQVM